MTSFRLSDSPLLPPRLLALDPTLSPRSLTGYEIPTPHQRPLKYLALYPFTTETWYVCVMKLYLLQFIILIIFSPQLRVGHVMFHRQQTAPSIPMAGQNYGYEESDDGRLKPQLVPAADSSMGPAYYNVSYVSSCS